MNFIKNPAIKMMLEYHFKILLLCSLCLAFVTSRTNATWWIFAMDSCELGAFENGEMPPSLVISTTYEKTDVRCMFRVCVKGCTQKYCVLCTSTLYIYTIFSIQCKDSPGCIATAFGHEMCSLLRDDIDACQIPTSLFILQVRFGLHVFEGGA